MRLFSRKTIVNFSPRLLFAPRRTLFQSLRVDQEILLTNNSGVFFALESLKQHGKDSHPNLMIFRTPCWLDHIDPRHENLKWGQRIHALPWYVRKIAEEKFPETYKKNNYLSWGQYKKLVSSAEEELLKQKVKFYKGNIKISLESDRFNMLLDDKEIFNLKSNTYFYNWSKIQNIEHGIKGIIGVPHTDIYNFAKQNEPKTIIMIGSGRSVVWALKHFPKIPFALIMRPGAKLPFLGNEKKEIKNIYKQYNLDDFTGKNPKFIFAQPNVNPDQLAIIEKGTGKSDFLASEYKLYCALGLDCDHKLTEAVPRKQTLFPYNERWSWVAPTEELPQGSLAESCSRWAKLTRNESWATELFAYHDSHAAELVAQKMHEKGFRLSNYSFSLFAEKMLKLKEVPTAENLTKLFFECYDNSKTDDFNKFDEALKLNRFIR